MSCTESAPKARLSRLLCRLAKLNAKMMKTSELTMNSAHSLYADVPRSFTTRRPCLRYGCSLSRHHGYRGEHRDHRVRGA